MSSMDEFKKMKVQVRRHIFRRLLPRLTLSFSLFHSFSNFEFVSQFSLRFPALKAQSVLFSGASFFESSSSFTKILTARLSRFICNDVTTTTQELRDALEAKGLDSSGLKAVLLSRLEESLEGGEGGGEEEKEEEEAEEEPLSAVEIEEEEKEPTPEPESEAPAATADAAAEPAKTNERKKPNASAAEEGELTKEQKEEMKKKKREEFKAKQKAEYEAREAKRREKKAEENKQFFSTLEERKQRAAKFDGPFILSDAEKRRVRECGAAAQFGLSEIEENATGEANANAQKKELVSAEERKQIEAEREAKKRARMERFGAEALKPLHPPKMQQHGNTTNKKAKLGGGQGKGGGVQDRNLTSYTI